MKNFDAFRSRDFRLYILGNAFALQAVWIQRITIAWIAWDLTGSASFVGWIAFLGFAPTIVTGPLFGVLVDRAPVLRVGQITQGTLSGLSLALALAHAAGLLGPFALTGFALAIGVAMSAHHPTRMSLAPRLAPREAVASVVMATSVNFNIARSVGPAIGGALIAGFGTGAALWASFLCTLPFQVVLRFLHPRDRAKRTPARQPVRLGLLSGLRRARRNGYIRDIMIVTALYGVLGRGVLEILPKIADGLFAKGPAGLGVLTSSAGIGALAGAGLVALLPAPAPHAPPRAGQIAALVGLGLTLGLALSPSWPLTVAAAAGLGAAGTVLGVSMQSALQLVLPDSYRGRVMSLWAMTGIGGSALGALLLGALSDLVGLAAGVALVSAAAVLLYAARPRGSR